MSAPVVPVAAGPLLTFLEHLKDGKAESLRITDLDVEEEVNGEIGPFPENLEVRNVRFRRLLSFRETEFKKDLTFVGCRFDEGVDFSGAIVRGRFHMIDGSVGKETPKDTDENAPKEPCLSFEYAEFKRDVDLVGLTIWGAILARGCQIAGNLWLSSMNVTSSVADRPAVDLGLAKIDGGISFHREPSDSAKELRGVSHNLVSGKTGGKAGSTYTAVGSKGPGIKTALNLIKMTVRGHVSFDGIECDPGIDCRFSTIDWILARPAWISGDFILSGCTLGGFQALGLALKGTLQMVTGKSGQFEIDTYFEDGRVLVSKVGAVVCTGWTCTDRARFGIRELGSSEGASQKAFGIGGIKISNSSFVGDLDFLCGINAMRDVQEAGGRAALTPEAALACDPWLKGPETTQPVEINGVTVGGDLTLTGVRTTDVIDLSDTRVTKSIRFSSPLSARTARVGFDPMRKNLILLHGLLQRDDLADECLDPMTSKARRLHMERTAADSIDLTGLLLDGSIGDGGVVATHIKVTRDLQISLRAGENEQRHYKKGLRDLAQKDWLQKANYLLRQTLLFSLNYESRAKVERKPNTLSAYMELAGYGGRDDRWNGALPCMSADISGEIRLNNAEIGLLRVTREDWNSFSQRCNPPRARQGTIVLDDASVGALCIYPSSHPTSTGAAIRPVSLRGVKVDSWRLGPNVSGPNSSEPEESNNRDDYLDLLDHEPGYRASTYSNIEKKLRDRGHDHAARQVYIAGKYREHRADLGSRSFPWSYGDGRQKWPFFLRLQRPWGETLESAALLACIVLYAAIALATLYHRSSIVEKALALLGFLILVGLGYRFLRGSFVRLVDRLYWSILDYGTSAWRLLLIIFVLAAVSFTLVARHPANFVKATTASAISAQPAASAAAASWDAADALWMTLRYHMPILDLAVMNEFEPAGAPLSLGVAKGGSGRPNWWKDYIAEWWPNARDWFGAMALLNFLLWPLFIPFVIHKLWRQDSDG